MAVYPFGGKRTGVQDIKDAINKRYRKIANSPLPVETMINNFRSAHRLSPVKTQHAITTQHITIHGDGKSADVVSYFTGKHFGQGKWAGQEVTAWGQYKDTLQLEIPGLRSQDKNDAIPGADGEWLISRREVGFMGRLGEEGVMDGE